MAVTTDQRVPPSGQRSAAAASGDASSNSTPSIVRLQAPDSERFQRGPTGTIFCRTRPANFRSLSRSRRPAPALVGWEEGVAQLRGDRPAAAVQFAEEASVSFVQVHGRTPQWLVGNTHRHTGTKQRSSGGRPYDEPAQRACGPSPGDGTRAGRRPGPLCGNASWIDPCPIPEPQRGFQSAHRGPGLESPGRRKARHRRKAWRGNNIQQKRGSGAVIRRSPRRPGRPPGGGE